MRWAVASTAIGALASAHSAQAGAQLPASVDSSLRVLFASGKYAGDRAAPAIWRDGTHYTTLEPSREVSGGTDIVEYTAGDGARRVLQNTDHLVLASAATGDVRTLLTEQDTTWVNVVEDFRWLDNGKKFLWTSERDGWRHVYVGDRATGALTLVTPGNYDVISVAGVDPAHNWLYIIASPTNATQQYLYRVSLTAPEAPVRVTPEKCPWHAFVFCIARW